MARRKEAGHTDPSEGWNRPTKPGISVVLAIALIRNAIPASRPRKVSRARCSMTVTAAITLLLAKSA